MLDVATPLPTPDEVRSAAARPPGGKLLGLQAARGVAAFCVMTQHATHESFAIYRRAGDFAAPLQFGVDLFFMVSGFIIVFTSAKLFGRRDGPAVFAWRRFARVVPLYWIFTTLMVGAILVMGARLRTAVFDPLQILYSYMFYPGYVRADGTISPVLALGWTLNYEIFFYVIFTPLLLLPRRAALACLTIGLAVFVAIFHPQYPDFAPLRFWSQPIVLEFAAGALLAEAYVSGWRLPRAGGFLAIGVGALMLVYEAIHPLPSEIGRYFTFGIPGFIILAGFAMMPDEHDARAWPLPLLLLGDASYSLYLSHPFTLKVLTLVWDKAHLVSHAPPWLFAACAVVAAVAVGWLSYVAVERPLLKLVRRGRAASTTP